MPSRIFMVLPCMGSRNNSMLIKKEFTPEGYRSLIEIALGNGYDFISFNETKNFSGKKFCLFRHDIDADLEAAKKLSAIEQSYNVKATYFLMLRSPVYNLFGRYNHRCVEELLKNGHEIALHYDEAFYPENNKPLQELVEIEAGVLEKMFGQKIQVVSFHQPGPKVLNNEIKLKSLINTYDRSDMEGIFYISDSNMIWKNKTAWDLFLDANEPRIQLLTHPMWWMGDGTQNTHALWDKALLDNMNRTLDQVISTEAAFGEKRGIQIKK
jgi:hypothetical protein